MRNNFILDKKLEYIRNLFAEEDDLLVSIREKAAAINRPININPEEGKLLQILIKLGNYKRILEIGTFYGYSTIWLARIIKDVDDAKIYTIEKDIDSVKIARENFKKANLEDKIIILNDTAENLLKNLDEKFDMVFIDAEKNHYLQYLDWAEKYIKKNGLIVADNTLLSGAVYSEELPYRIRESTKKTIQLFNEKLSNKDKYLSILLPAEDGISIAIKKF